MGTVHYHVEFFEGSRYWEIIRTIDGERTVVTTKNSEDEAILLAEKLNLQAVGMVPKLTAEDITRQW